MKHFIFLSLLSFCLPIKATLFFQDGIKWITEYYSSSSFTPIIFDQTVEYYKTDNIDNSERGFLCWVTSDRKEKGELEIKIENEKVYFKNTKTSEIEWYLFYDFSLKPGEGCYIYSPNSFDSDGLPYKTYITCVEIKENNPEYDGWTTMSLVEYENENLDSFPENGVWIKNLSSAYGVLENNRFNMDGMGSKLILASLNDSVIYESEPAAIKNLSFNEINDISLKTEGFKIFIENLDKALDLKLYSFKGESFSFKKENNSFCLEVPHSGIYILTIDGITYKILIK